MTRASIDQAMSYLSEQHDEARSRKAASRSSQLRGLGEACAGPSPIAR